MAAFKMLLPLGLAAGVVGLLFASRTKARFIGDKAQVGDDVFVPITSLPPGSLPAAFPAGAGSVVVRVSAVDPKMAGPGGVLGVVVGTITDYVIQEIPRIMRLPLPTPVGPVRVPQSLITSVWRGGRELSM